MKLFPESVLLLKNWRSVFFAFICGLFFILLLATPSWGATVEELQKEIEERNAQLTQLEADIAKYEEELTKIGADRKTLENEINRLDVLRRKLSADITATETRIRTTNLELDDLSKKIEEKEQKIEVGKRAIQNGLRELSRLDDATIAELVLSAEDISQVWETGDQLRRLQTTLSDQVYILATTKDQLTKNFEEVVKKQGLLVSAQKELSGQKSVFDANRRTQSSLLTQTRSKESEYQKLLEERRQARLQLEAEIREFEGAIEYTLDPSKIPSPGAGVLRFPLENQFMERCRGREKVFGNIYCITQYFGNTPFARTGAYNGRGHNGIDFGMPEGTKILSALSGVVVATGNTDEIRGCFSYGKWVLIRHPNNLATLYAHLSHISVNPNEPVASGSLIGLSGNTGFSTGPHLHFTVFVADAVQIVRLGDIKTRTNCANARIPVAPTEAYLNPLAYL